MVEVAPSCAGAGEAHKLVPRSNVCSVDVTGVLGGSWQAVHDDP